MKRTLLQALCVVALSFTACSLVPIEQEPPAGGDARSSLARITTAAPPAHVADTVRGLNDFTFSLHRRIAKPTENFASAPVSVTTALAMTSAGAVGTTLDGFNQALRVQLPKADFHGALNTIDRELASRGQGAQGFNGKPFALKLTNQLFAQTGYSLEQPFLDLLALQYGAGVKLLDFEKQPDVSRRAINDFIDFHTSNLIPELLPGDAITSDTRLVLANAVYFNAAWAQKFDTNLTRPAPFRLITGTTVQTPTMSISEVAARTAQVGGVEVVELPYEKNEVSMLVLMPAQGQLGALEQTLSAATLQSFVAALQPEELQLSMPKFEVKTPTNLNEALEAEGLEVAYDGSRADFSGLSSRAKADGLHITDVLHEAVIKVSEGGTEAAGATAVVVGGRETAAPAARPLALDRPFVFVLRDRATGVVLFLGHVVDPR
jgi:serpin B